MTLRSANRRFDAVLVIAFVTVIGFFATPAVAGNEPSIIGWLELYRVQPGDTFPEIPRRHDLGLHRTARRQLRRQPMVAG